MKILIVLIGFLAWVCLAGLSKAQSQSIGYIKTIPAGLPGFHKTEQKFTVEHLKLGERLFFSKDLSQKSISCATCHEPAEAMSMSRLTLTSQYESVVLSREIPAVFNLAWMPVLMWDGRAATISKQVLLPLESRCEMNIDWLKSLEVIRGYPETQSLLLKNSKSDLSRHDVAEALAEYTSRIVSGESRFDRYFYLGEDRALTEVELQGLSLFRGKARCSSCHLINSDFALFTDGMFHSVGIGFNSKEYTDHGRAAVTMLKDDEGLFKTPTLRNISKNPPYMHDGSLSSLREVIDFYNKGGAKAAPGKDPKIQPLNLSENEIVAIEAFLLALDSETKVFIDFE